MKREKRRRIADDVVRGIFGIVSVSDDLWPQADVSSFSRKMNIVLPNENVELTFELQMRKSIIKHVQTYAEKSITVSISYPLV